MSRNVNDIINKLSPAQRKKVEARAATLIAEEMTLAELRRIHKLAQQFPKSANHVVLIGSGCLVENLLLKDV